MSSDKDHKIVGSIHHPGGGDSGHDGSIHYSHIYHNKKTNTYHHEDEHGGYPDEPGHKSPQHALKSYQKAHAAFNQRESDMSHKEAHKYASGLQVKMHGDKMHKTEEDEIAKFAKMQKSEHEWSPMENDTHEGWSHPVHGDVTRRKDSKKVGYHSIHPMTSPEKEWHGTANAAKRHLEGMTREHHKAMSEDGHFKKSEDAHHPGGDWKLHDHQTSKHDEMKVYKKPSQIGNEKYRAVYASKDGSKVTHSGDHGTAEAAQMAGFTKHYSDMKKSEHPAFTENKGKINEIMAKDEYGFKKEKDAIDQFMKSEPKMQEYKGHHIERTHDHRYEGSGFDTKKVATPEQAQYNVHHTDKDGKMHLHSTTFSSADHAKKYIDGLKKTECMEMHKAEEKHLGVRSFDHRKNTKDKNHRSYGKHWTVAHKAPKEDHGYHTHTHHFDTAHQAGKYAQHWEDTVGQHNNHRPEVYGPEYDEK